MPQIPPQGSASGSRRRTNDRTGPELGQAAQAQGHPNEDTNLAVAGSLGPTSSFIDVLARLSISDNSDSDGLHEGIDTPPAENQSWVRPTLPHIRSGDHRITFQVVEIQSNVDNKGDSQIQLFGLTEAGHSVMAAVYGFEHYLYYPAPTGFATSDIEPLEQYLNNMFKDAAARIELESSRPQYAEVDAPFLKIHVRNFMLVQKMKDFFLQGKCEYRDMFTSPEKTCEANVPYTLRFMLDTQVLPLTWLRLLPGKYRVFKEGCKTSRCQIEVAIDWEDLQICDVASGEPKLAPLRILSFDIECDVPRSGFAHPSRQSVFQIANMVCHVGEKDPFVRNVFTLKKCSPITGSQVLSYPTETEMLLAWHDFFLEVDPDIVIGYNITQFDIQYLIRRASALKIERFPFLGRLKDKPQILPPDAVTFNTCPGYDGRLLIDMYFHIRDAHPKLPGPGAFKLNNAAWHFLQERKEDIEYTQIPLLQNGNPHTRRQLAIYCLKDTYLPLRLFQELDCFKKEMDAAKSFCLPHGVLRLKPHWKGKTKKYLDAIEQGYLFMDVK